MTDDICECRYFGEGDWVECKLNTDQFGIIINESGFGRYYEVQLCGSLEIKTFHWGTLRHIEDPDIEYPPLQAATADSGNVIKVDFTKRPTLRRDTPTGGAA